MRSPDFAVSDRARKFFAYVVDETLIGRADRVKAYSIATEVLGRDASFDGAVDPVVRIEGGRIRRALDLYYLKAGASDPIIITIPKGGYVATFTRRDHLPKTLGPSCRASGCKRGERQAGRWLVAAVAAALSLAALFAGNRAYLVGGSEQGRWTFRRERGDGQYQSRDLTRTGCS